jgi:Ser/Thr protein kinase RdoA (MazF antagonist)
LLCAAFLAVNHMREIREVLQHYPLDCQPSRVEPLGSAGGMSGAQFWRLAAPRGELGLRRWPPEHPTPERLRFIHAVLAHAKRHGITFLPIPITTHAGQSFVQHADHLWEIAPWMPGVANYAQAPSTEKLRAAMIALAKIHVAVQDFSRQGSTTSDGGSPAINDRLTRLHELSQGGQQKLAQAITNTHWPELAPLAREFLGVLPRALPGVIASLQPLAHTPLPLQPCLRDVWHDNVLFTGNQVTGIVDFGALDIDTPACDIARLLGSLVGDDADGWHTGVTAYTTVRVLSTDELCAVSALDISGTMIAGCNWIRWIYIEDRRFEDPTQVVRRFRAITARAAKPRSG